MSERQIELVWRCSSCQHQNLGRHAICQSCGNPKDESEEYEDDADEYEESEDYDESENYSEVEPEVAAKPSRRERPSA